jgi:hypothetical protein
MTSYVQPDADAVAATVLTQGRDQERRRIDDGAQLNHQLALQQRLAHQAEVKVAQVAQPAVDHLR